MEINFIFSLKEGESFSRPLDPIWFERQKNGIAVKETTSNRTIKVIEDGTPTKEVESEIQKILDFYKGA